MNNDHYYSIVTDRIKELEKDLERAKNEGRTDLEIEVLTKKIEHLRKIELLPLYISIQSLSEAEIYEMETKKNITFSTLEQKLHLSTVRNTINRNKTVPLAYIKEALLEDYESLSELLELQNINLVTSSKIQTLFNCRNMNSSLIHITIKENKLEKYESDLNKSISSLQEDYNFDTLKQITFYNNNPETKLPIEFILKHKDKVIENNPEMKKTIDKLIRKDKFGFITKIFDKKRNKYEEMFLSSLLSAYQNDKRLEKYNIESDEELFTNSHTIKKFIKKLERRITSKKTEIKDLKLELNKMREPIISEIKAAETLREKSKTLFMNLLKNKTTFLPEIFKTQLWNEPNLKESIINVACIQEEQELLNKINNHNIPRLTFANVDIEDFSKKLIA